MPLPQMTAAKGASAKVAGVKTAGAFSGKTLGLGIGAGAWGPVIFGVIGAAAIYGYIKSREAEASQADEDLELAEALSEI